VTLVTPPGAAGGSTPARPRKRPLIIGLIVLSALLAGGYWWWDHFQARRAWSAAEAALARRDLAIAAARLDRYLSLRPGDAQGWFQAARTARRRGEFAEAGRLLAEYEKLGGAAAAAQFERELALVQQGRGGDLDRRLRARYGPTDPDVALVLEALARGYMVTDRRADLLQACELWNAVDTDHPWPYLWAGLVREKMGLVELAAELYGRALDLAPDDPDAQVAQGRILTRLRRPAEAAEHFRRVLDRYPDDDRALLGYAECLLDLSRPDEAVTFIAKALLRDPNSQKGLYLRGRATLPRDPAAAELDVRKAVEADSSDPEALYLLVQCLRAQLKDGEADRSAARLEVLRADLNRLGEFLKQITTSLEDAKPCHEAGLIALRLGRKAQAVNLFQDALRRKGDHRPTHAALAEYYEREGSRDLAAYHKRLSELLPP